MKKQADKSRVVRVFAIGALLTAVAGYVAGLLTAPKSGRETRADIKNKAEGAVAATERELKKLHTELTDVIDEVSDRLGSLKNRKDVGDALERGRDAKQKAREVLSLLHDGETDDKELKKAIADATKAIEHLRDFLRK
jgi:gas vesicle protein